MKKSFIAILSFSILLIFLQGCKKTLEEVPKTFISPENYFTNPGSYDAAVMGIYAQANTLSSDRYILSMVEMFSDIYGPPSASVEQAMPSYRNGSEPFFYNVRGSWSIPYTVIKNANFILSKLATATMDDATKNALTAEVRFLRGYAYYILVQFYGDVPLRKVPVENFSDVQLPRSSQADVYNFILEDLIYAETNLPDVAPQQGRVYKSVATAMLARVYLTSAGNPLNITTNYTLARDKALAVINSGKFTLKNDYATVFHNTAYSTESIWERLFYPSTGGNDLQVSTSTATGYLPTLVPATWFINSFSTGDQRKVWGIQQSYVDPTGKILAPFFLKYVDTTFINTEVLPSGAGLLNYSIPIIRLAEMYLIAAECENEINGPANAYQYINKIRLRARVNKSDPTNVPDLAGLTKDTFRDAVLMERKWELHLEGQTWFDLKRTNTISRIQTIRGGDLLHPIGAYNQTWYIPDVEIQNNNIPQNPSYN
jgi:hypothetical protein